MSSYILDQEDNRKKFVFETENIKKYPQDLRILAVDDNPVCLKLLSAVLQKCGYQFTATTQAIEAYEILKKNKDSYDLVLTDAKNNMDGFKLAELINLEMDIPVIIMSADDGTESIMKGIRHGARDYILKPIRYEELKIIWQHVARKDHLRRIDPNPLPLKRHRENSDELQSDDTEAQINEEVEEVLPKKPRFKWTEEIHLKFVNVVQQLGRENAVPKRILEIMNEPTLTRENIASHLQKYRKNADNKEKRGKPMMQEKVDNHNLSSNNVNYYHNISTQQTVADTNLISFGENLRAQATRPQSNLRFHSHGGQVSSTFVTNSITTGSSSSSANSFYSNQQVGPKQVVTGMRSDSLHSRRAQMENNYYGSYSSSSFSYNNSHNQPTSSQLMSPPTNSLPLLPPSSSNDTTHPTCKTQPTNSLPMAPMNFSCDATQPSWKMQPTNSLPMAPMNFSCDATHTTQKMQPTNSLPIAPMSYSSGQLQRGNSLISNEKEKVNNFSSDPKEQASIDGSNWQLPFLDQIIMSSGMECNEPLSYSGNEFVVEDDLHVVISQFGNNPTPSL